MKYRKTSTMPRRRPTPSARDHPMDLAEGVGRDVAWDVAKVARDVGSVLDVGKD